MIIRFFDHGGHDAGSGNSKQIPGTDVDVRDNNRIADLQHDPNPAEKLRSPYGSVRA